MIRRLFLGLLSALLLVSCGDPRDTGIPTDPARWDSTVQPVIARLPDEDRRLAVSYLARIKAEAALTGQPIASGLTLRSGILDERDFQRTQASARLEARQLQDREQQQRKEFDQRVAEVLSVRLLKKEVAPTNLTEGDRSDRATVEIEVRNVGNQEIAEISGVMALMDGFMRERLKSFDFRYTQPLAAGESARYQTTLLLDPFLISDLRLRNTDTAQVGLAFHARIVRFADGRLLEAPIPPA